MTVIVLAAGEGTRLRPLTDDRPKCLVPVAGRPLLEWQLAAISAADAGDVVLVGGHQIDRLRPYAATVVENERYASTNMVESLLTAWPSLRDGSVVSYGDIAYRAEVLRTVLETEGDIVVAVDLDWRSYWEARFTDPLEDAESLTMDVDHRITSIGQRPSSVEEIEGQYIGLLRFSPVGAAAFRDAYERLVANRAEGRKLYMTDVLHQLAATGAVRAAPFHGGWIEVDSRADLDLAEALIADGRLGPTTL
jgi:choline kinase